MEYYTLSQIWTDYTYLEKKGGRGLISIKDCVQLAVRGLDVYVHGCEERLIQPPRGDKIDGLEAFSIQTDCVI